MWSFQLIGWSAANNKNNFNDWAYNRAQWWEGVHNNWAGGGGPESGDGDPGLYLMEWPADSTVGILDQWFGDDGLGLDDATFQYWNMDNEPEIWNGTHDDVMPEQISAEKFMLLYFDVAKKARAKFPDIKLVGPVTANEWQWYNWANDKINYNNKNYTYLEYFILRVAEEQQASGVRLLDVLDIHFYPGEEKNTDIVQLHRVWFDKTYNYPGANGVKRAGSGGWDNNITKEYVFARCSDWLEKYMGPDHGVTFGVTEMGIKGNDPNVTASWYASTLGVFADQGVELFTPWTWKTGMWEVLHLFSRYNKNIRVASGTDLEEFVSAYSTINSALDSLTVFLVNRTLDQSQDVTVNIHDFTVANGEYEYLMLNNLPEEETFKTHSNNALQEGTVSVQNGSFNLSLPSLSITAVLFTGQGTTSSIKQRPNTTLLSFDIYPNPFNPATTLSYYVPSPVNVNVDIFDINGRLVRRMTNLPGQSGSHSIRFDGSNLASGIYFVRFLAGSRVKMKKIMLIK